jgi:uncharacterized membrane protein
MGNESESGVQLTAEQEQKRADTKAGISTGRAFDRLINMSDAIVAVAMTVNVLSIVGIRRTSNSESVWDVISANGGQIGSFCFTFLIVGVMWLAHNRILNHMRGYDSTIFWLNLVWLLLIALLPWPTTMYGISLVFGNADAVSDQAGVGLFYWGTLAAISAIGGLIGLHSRRRPALLEPGNPVEAQGQARAWVFALFFLVIGIVSMFSPLWAAWLPLGLIVVSIVLRRRRVVA